MASARQTIERFLADCDVRVGGGRPTDLQVHDDRLYARLLAQGSLGLGESYMDGWWDVADLDGFITRVLEAGVDQRVHGWSEVAAYAAAHLSNLQSRARAFQVGEHHYDIGNDLYERMLDRRMIYSCAYWVNASTLDAAQEAKLDLVFDKLQLQGGQQVLDIGCGWGGALRYAVERHGIRGVGVTVSREQAALAQAACAQLPVEIRLTDYRALEERFDHVYSIGMFEHVGSKNYRTYFETVRRCLVPEGRFLLHTIGSRRLTHNDIDPWIGRYIFPNAVVPQQRQITEAIDGLFFIEGWQCIGPHYDPTLMAWRRNFDGAWPELSATRDERFRRMWHYYLGACAAGFRAGITDVWQVLLAPVPPGHQ
ncbi:MAG: cyclopropane fatty acyl phospholipid synthase [Steroidobacteraceae bacterium]